MVTMAHVSVCDVPIAELQMDGQAASNIVSVATLVLHSPKWQIAP